MTSPNTDGNQFRAEAEAFDDEERHAREILERKAEERKRKASLEKGAVVEEVVKPEDDPLHMELQQFVEVRDGDEMVDTRNGRLVEWNEQGLLRYAKEWPHAKMTYKGTVWEYREPKKLAQVFLAASTNSKTSPKRRMEGLIGFLTHVLSERSLERMQNRAFDHEDDFDVDDMGRIMQFVQQGRTGVVDAPEVEPGAPAAVEG